MDSLDQNKVDVLTTTVRDINPKCGLAVFPMGVNQDNLRTFFQGADNYVDGLAFDVRACFCLLRSALHPRHYRGPGGHARRAVEFFTRRNNIRAIFSIGEPPTTRKGCSFLNRFRARRNLQYLAATWLFLGIAPRAFQFATFEYPQSAEPYDLSHDTPAAWQECIIW